MPSHFLITSGVGANICAWLQVGGLPDDCQDSTLFPTPQATRAVARGGLGKVGRRPSGWWSPGLLISLYDVRSQRLDCLDDGLAFLLCGFENVVGYFQLNIVLVG